MGLRNIGLNVACKQDNQSMAGAISLEEGHKAEGDRKGGEEAGEGVSSPSGFEKELERGWLGEGMGLGKLGMERN